MRKLLLLLFLCLLSSGLLTAQDRTISGKVIDVKTGEALPGVSVSIKGTTKGTITGVDGTYSIQASSENTLLFQAIGLVSQEIIVGNQSTLDLSMTIDTTDLEEVVITGYRDEDKRTFTGSATAVTSKSIALVPVASIDQILQG